MHNDENMGFSSKAVHSGAIDCLGSAVTPIFQTSTFRFRDVDHGARCFSGEKDGYIYTRIGNPSITELEDAVAALEMFVPHHYNNRVSLCDGIEINFVDARKAFGSTQFFIRTIERRYGNHIS